MVAVGFGSDGASPYRRGSDGASPYHSTSMSLPISLPTSRIEPAAEAPVLRWGIMGPGWIAERFIESVRAHTRQDFVAVGSRDKKRAEEFASRMGLRQAYGDYKELVEAADLDVIYVATPHNFHHAGVILALNAGKHVLVEKPIALNRAQAFEMVELARRKRLFFAEALGHFTFRNSMCFANFWKQRPMFLLTGWMLYKGGIQGLKLNLTDVKYHGWDALPMMITAIALVAGYYAGPVLNFGDFTRYCKSYEVVKRGNTWGLPVNYLAFALVTVVTISLTVPVFGEMITDPVDVVGRLDSVTAVLLGALTFVVATIGINIVANFVPPAFDITNIAPNKISWRAGGMIAATLSVFTTPWNLFSNPAVIHYTIDILACAIGPLYGILLVDYYVIKKEQIVVEDLYSMSPNGRYWYQGGVNLKAVYALIPASLIGFTFTMVPPFNIAQGFSLFIGAGLAALFYFVLARSTALAAAPVPTT